MLAGLDSDGLEEVERRERAGRARGAVLEAISRRPRLGAGLRGNAKPLQTAQLPAQPALQPPAAP